MTSSRCPLCHVPSAPLETDVARCSACDGLLFRPTEGPRVLVAYDHDAMAEQIGRELQRTGFSVTRVKDGTQALRALDELAPDALVLDVGLSGAMTFDVIQAVRQRRRLAASKVVLVSSVYNKAAYKRRPTNLYGADDYVEQHHVHDMLPEKICSLLGISALVSDSTPTQTPERIVAAAHQPSGLAQGAERVRELAHSIVADIALYHQAEIELIAQGGDVSALAAALDEGRRLLRELATGTQVDGDPLREAFDSFVSDMRGGAKG